MTEPITLIGIVAAAHLLLRLYIQLRGRECPWDADLAGQREKVERAGPWAWPLYAITSLLLLAHNLVLGWVWVVSSLMQDAANLFGPALRFVLRCARHYLVRWPADVVKAAGGGAFTAFSWPALLAGAIGTVPALLLITLGRWIDLVMLDGGTVALPAGIILGTVPLALAAGTIASMHRAGVRQGGWAAVRKHLPGAGGTLRSIALLVFMSLALLSLEWLIWSLASMGSGGAIGAAVLALPAIAGSALVAANALILAAGLQVIPGYRLDHSADLRSSYLPLVHTSARMAPAIAVSLPFVMAIALLLSIPGYLAVNGGLWTSARVFATLGHEQAMAAATIAMPGSLEELNAMPDEAFDRLTAQGGSTGGARAVGHFLLTYTERPFPMAPYTPDGRSGPAPAMVATTKEEDAARQGAITTLQSTLEAQKGSLDLAAAALKQIQQAEADPTGEAIKALRSDASNPFRNNTAATLQMLVEARQQDVSRSQQELDGMQRLDQRLARLREAGPQGDDAPAAVWLILALADALLFAFAFGLVLPALIHGGLALYERDRARTPGTELEDLWNREAAIAPRQPLVGLLCAGAVVVLFIGVRPLGSLPAWPASPPEEQPVEMAAPVVVDELRAAEEGMLEPPVTDEETRRCRLEESRMLDGPDGEQTATLLRKGDLVTVQGSTPDGRFFKGTVRTPHGPGMVGWWRAADFEPNN
jgi:hypothetical protein